MTFILTTYIHVILVKNELNLGLIIIIITIEHVYMHYYHVHLNHCTFTYTHAHTYYFNSSVFPCKSTQQEDVVWAGPMNTPKRLDTPHSNIKGNYTEGLLGRHSLYRIVGNLRGRKPSQIISRFYNHRQKLSPLNFRHATPIYAISLTLNFRESFLLEMLPSYRSTKVFFLKSFPLYSTSMCTCTCRGGGGHRLALLTECCLSVSVAHSLGTSPLTCHSRAGGHGNRAVQRPIAVGHT